MDDAESFKGMPLEQRLQWWRGKLNAHFHAGKPLPAITPDGYLLTELLAEVISRLKEPTP